jgi:hypothetical protein
LTQQLTFQADRGLASPLSFVPFGATVQSLRVSSFTAVVPNVKPYQAGEKTADPFGLSIPQLYVFADEVIE